MLLHFLWNQISIELRPQTSWTMLLDNLNHALTHIFVADYLFLKAISIDPFDLWFLISVLRNIKHFELVIHELFKDRIQLLLRFLNVANVALVFLHVVSLILLRVNDEYVRQFLWPQLEELGCFFFISAVVYIKYVAIISKNIIVLIWVHAHKDFWPKYEKYGFCCIFTIFELLPKLFHIGVENEFNIVTSFKASVEHFGAEVLSLDSIGFFKLFLKLFRTYEIKIRHKLISTDALKSL